MKRGGGAREGGSPGRGPDAARGHGLGGKEAAPGPDPGRVTWRWGLLAAAVLLSLAFYREFVFHADRMLFGTDMLLEGHPLRRFAVEEMRAGRGLPLWNPYLFAGLPYLATLPGPVFYPTSLLYLVLPLHRAIGWTFVIHTALAAAFAYFAARSFRLSRPSAAVSALAFAFSGYLLSTLHGGHDGRMFAIVLVPLALGALERALRTGSTAWFAALAIVVALQAFTPHTQILYFSSLVLLGHAAFRIWLAPVRETGAGKGALPAERGARWRPALGVALALLGAGALGAVQILPTFALLDGFVRAAHETGYAFAASWALPPQEVTALVLPDLIGSLEGYWGSNPFKLHTEYLGAVPVALGALALAASLRPGGRLPGVERAGKGPRSGKRRNRETGSAGRFDPRMVWFLALVSVLATLFALGAATPVHRIAYEVVPLVDRFRAPVMMLGPASALVALLAGYGWEAAREARRRDDGLPWGAILGLSTPFLLLGLVAALVPGTLHDFAHAMWYPAGWPRRPSPELAGALRASGLFLLGGWGGTLLAARLAERGSASEAILLLPLLLLLVVDLWRVDARYLRTAEAEEHFRPDPAARILAERLRPGERVWPAEDSYAPNRLMLHGIPSVSGTQKFLLVWYARLVGGVGHENLLRSAALWDLLDLRYLTARSELDTPLLRPVPVEGDVRVYELTADAPHAWFPGSVRAVTDTAEALRLVLSLEDPAELAIVEEDPAPPAGAGRAVVREWTPDRVRLGVSADREGLLFVSEAWAPGWRAFVNGERTDVLRVNVAFRGVVVPAGEHEVRLEYAPASFRVGAAISASALLTLLGVLGVSAYGRWRQRGGAAGEGRASDGRSGRDGEPPRSAS